MPDIKLLFAGTHFISMSDIQTLVDAFIRSKLGNCNSLLPGLPKFRTYIHK